ncbi:MAG: hypothetical protein R3Y43_01340 [Alphaproteobacteria bacterium]
MTTRCIIKIKGYYNGKIDIYHHADGYPDGVGLDLYNKIQPLLEENIGRIEQGYSLKNNFGTIIESVMGIDNGYEFTENRHFDIDYMYIIDMKKSTILCHEGYYDDDGFKVVCRHDLAKVKEHEEKQQLLHQQQEEQKGA